jgi:hypothetical protein
LRVFCDSLLDIGVGGLEMAVPGLREEDRYEIWHRDFGAFLNLVYCNTTRHIILKDLRVRDARKLELSEEREAVFDVV